MVKLYKVELSEDEQTQLQDLTKRGKSSARKLTRAHILRLAHEGASDARIAASLHVGVATVERIRKRFVEGGLERALNEDARPGVPPKLDGKQEAYLVALACSSPPEGQQRWTMQLLADALVRLEVVDTLSDETVRRTLKKKRGEAVAPGGMVHSECGAGVCVADGGRAGLVRPTVRPGTSGGVF